LDPDRCGLFQAIQQLTRLDAQTVSESQDRGLEPPPGDCETINSMLALVDSQALIEEELASASRAVDIDKIKTLLEQGKPIKAKAQGIAQGYGFKVCGSSNTSS
jgi:hypothetical protein